MIWHTETRKISELKNWEDNPRTISKEAYQELKESIDDLGNFEPLVVNVDGTVIAGNQRLRVHIENGDSEVEVSVPERELTEEEIKKIGIISNRHSGEWDMDKLANEFEDVLEELGFDDLMPEVELDVEEDDYEEPEDLEIKVKTGEVWQLGKHRLMCGDSTKIEDVEKLMNGQKADMVFTDPPYGVNYASKNEFLNNQDEGNRIQVDIENDTMTLDETSDFIYKCFVNIRLFLAEKSSYYITAPQGGDLLMMMMMMMQKAGIPLRHMLIWVKNNHVLGRTDYNYKHEPILFGWINTHNFYGKGDWQFSTWEIDKPLKNDLHPTMKPIALMVNAILNSTLKDNTVLDLFGGSGSTLIACEQTNRVCYMMELDERYATVILDRWEKLTGEKGIKLED
jgi:DNA modification methylase